MPSIDTALFTRVSTFAGFAALAGTRLYPPPVPQNPTYPLATYQQISGVRGYVYGPSEDGFVDARFQFDSWATTPTGARALAEQVRLALSAYKGTSDTIVIDLVTLELEQGPMWDDDAGLHRVIQDYKVTYRQP